MYRIAYSTLADADITDAAKWFISQGAFFAAENFFKTIAAKEQHLKNNPHIYPTVKHDVRVAYLHPYRHGLYFRVMGERVLVIACVHSSRNPRWISHMLLNR